MIAHEQTQSNDSRERRMGTRRAEKSTGAKIKLSYEALKESEKTCCCNGVIVAD